MAKLLNSRWTYLAAAGVLVAVALYSQLEIRVPTRPWGSAEDIARLGDRQDLNLIFVLIDTLRADRLGAYGYSRPTSPVLDDLASFGVRFARVEAQSSWTKTSMASLWTGLAPHRSGITRFQHALPPEALLPAELLRDAGFRTGGIYRNGWVASNFGFDQGFELYVRPTPSRTPERLQRHSPGTSALQGTDLDATEAAIEFIRHRGDERFFLYLHYMDAHQYLYDDAAAALDFGTSYSDAYDRAIHWVDYQVGRLLLELEGRDLFRRTVVVVASDHGEEFYEHQGEGHARTLYREVTEVPWIVGLPYRLNPGIVVEPLVRNIDLWPTLLDLLGLPPLPDTDGRSVLPLITAAAQGQAGEVEPLPAFAFLDQTWGRRNQESRPLASLRLPGKRILWRPGEPDSLRVFDHQSDPREQRDLAGELGAEERSALRPAMDAALAGSIPWSSTPEVEIDEMRLGQLRALGYAVR
jgi:arylsulfatase A-like enzyme